MASHQPVNVVLNPASLHQSVMIRCLMHTNISLSHFQQIDLMDSTSPTTAADVTHFTGPTTLDRSRHRVPLKSKLNLEVPNVTSSESKHCMACLVEEHAQIGRCEMQVQASCGVTTYISDPTSTCMRKYQDLPTICRIFAQKAVILPSWKIQVWGNTAVFGK